MSLEQGYLYNDRRYRLTARPEGGWTITTSRMWDSPVHRGFCDYRAASEAFWRVVAATILCSPRRWRGADLNGTVVALVPDDHGRVHLVEHGEPGGDHAVAFTRRATALAAWRNRCCALVCAAARRPRIVPPG